MARRLARLTVRPGDRIALLAGNGKPFVAAAAAVLRAGATLVPLHTGLPVERLAELARRAGAGLVLHDAAHSDQALALGVPCLQAEELQPQSLPTRAEPGRPAAILFTSGTTGTPRGVVLTHGSFASSAAASRALLRTGPGDRWLACLPLFHVGGLALLFRAAHDGFDLEIQPGFEPQAVAEALCSGRVTHGSLVARMLERLLDAARKPFSPAVRAVLVGGGPAPEPLLAEARARGLPVLRTYGLTEACSQVATQRPGDADPSCGAPLPGTSVAIDPIEGGDGAGEILVRGATVMSGYLDEEPLGGRWLRTGDIGRLDASGRLFVLDRRVDLVVTGGENVAPAEVEGTLALHPAVEECCVVGIPDPAWGQRVCAVVRLRRPASDEELRRHCRERLAAFQVPRAFVTAAAPLPRSDGGKLRRAEVRDWLALRQADL
jgi:O-succinylbenzoic acid--CoA ligase